MSLNALPVSRLVKVEVNLSPLAAQIQNLSTLLIVGNSDVIDIVERARPYATLEEVAADFGTTSPEYLAAVLWFEQAPQPTTLVIGRWADADTKGKLIGGLLSPTDEAIGTWAAITDGGFHIAIDGGASTNITGLNFSAETNLNGVASVIQAGLTGATCVYNGVMQRFEIASASTGASSEISFLTAPTAGTDISTLMNCTNLAGDGAYVANGIVAETALAAVVALDILNGGTWYAVTVLGAVDDDHLAIAPYIEGANTKHIYGVTTQEAGTLSSVSTSDIAYQLSILKYKKTVVQYSSFNPYAVCSLLARILTVDYTGNNTVITLMYKQEPGIVAESVGVGQVAALEAKHCNIFVNYNNDTAIIENGVVSSGDFMDIITGMDWLSLDIQNAVYNLLYTSLTKIPQTNAGVHLILTTIENECSQAVTNGLLAPGVWNSGGFGSLSQGDYLAKGFYAYAPPLSKQNQADREKRKAPTIQVAVKLAGAIHSVDILINVNR